MKIALNLIVVTSLMLTHAACAHAGVTLSDGIRVSNSGLGFGSAPPILTLNNGSNNNGGVGRSSGIFTDVFTGDNVIENKSQTLTSLEVATEAGTSNLGLFFNGNESGQPPQSLDIVSITVTLYNADGTILDTGGITYNPVKNFVVDGGQGGDGWFFALNLMPATATDFFSDASNRLGVAAVLQNTSAGAESFRIAAIPEPSAFLFLGSLATLGAVRPLA